MHRLSASFVLAYHGCDRSVGEKLPLGKGSFRKSDNAYDWLGPGMYFWQSNPSRAMQFAVEKRNSNQGIRRPFVIGAVIDLGLCLDLTTKESLEEVQDAHQSLIATLEEGGGQAPLNGPAVWMRYLDCAVIRRLHAIIADSGSPPIDTVRGIFQEGDPIYPGSAFFEKTHIQIAVVNSHCVKAVFRVQQPVIP